MSRTVNCSATGCIMGNWAFGFVISTKCSTLSDADRLADCCWQTFNRRSEGGAMTAQRRRLRHRWPTVGTCSLWEETYRHTWHVHLAPPLNIHRSGALTSACCTSNCSSNKQAVSVCRVELWWYICPVLYKSRLSLTLSRYYVNWKCAHFCFSSNV